MTPEQTAVFIVVVGYGPRCGCGVPLFSRHFRVGAVSVANAERAALEVAHAHRLPYPEVLDIGTAIGSKSPTAEHAEPAA